MNSLEEMRQNHQCVKTAIEVIKIEDDDDKLNINHKV